MPTKPLLLIVVLAVASAMVGCGSKDDAPPPASATQGGVSKKASDVGISTGPSAVGGNQPTSQ